MGAHPVVGIRTADLLIGKPCAVLEYSLFKKHCVNFPLVFSKYEFILLSRKRPARPDRFHHSVWNKICIIKLCCGTLGTFTKVQNAFCIYLYISAEIPFLILGEVGFGNKLAVQLGQNHRNMLKLSCPAEQPGCRILHQLKFPSYLQRQPHV